MGAATLDLRALPLGAAQLGLLEYLRDLSAGLGSSQQVSEAAATPDFLRLPAACVQSLLEDDKLVVKGEEEVYCALADCRGLMQVCAAVVPWCCCPHVCEKRTGTETVRCPET